jgi:hypothetical protein
MKDQTRETLLATLKRHNPHKVRAYNGEDDSRDIAVPQRRRRWASVIEAIEAKPWSRVEMLDKSGAVLGYCDNEGPSRDVEDLAPSFSGIGGQLLLGERIAHLCMTSVAKAVAQRDDETKALLAAQRDVVKEMASAVQALGEVYREQTVAAEQAAESRAIAAAAGEGGQLKELMEALPVLMQALPLLRGLLGSGEAAPLPNGARKGH